MFEAVWLAELLSTAEGTGLSKSSPSLAAEILEEWHEHRRTAVQAPLLDEPPVSEAHPLPTACLKLLAVVNSTRVLAE